MLDAWNYSFPCQVLYWQGKSLVSRVAPSLECQNAGMLECLECWLPVECWNAGMPECQMPGMPECQNARMPEL